MPTPLHYRRVADAIEDGLLDEPASKTQRKQDAHDLQTLGKDLIALPLSRVTALNLPETLLEAVRAAKKITAHEAGRRQLQYIGKLMRKHDVTAIREAVAEFKLGRAHNALALHEAETWRDQLIHSDEAVTRWIAQFPDTDAQRLRNLVRNARKEAQAAIAAAKPGEAPRQGKGYREVFQLVKAALTASPAESDAHDDDETNE